MDMDCHVQQYTIELIGALKLGIAFILAWEVHCNDKL